MIFLKETIVPDLIATKIVFAVMKLEATVHKRWGEEPDRRISFKFQNGKTAH